MEEQCSAYILGTRHRDASWCQRRAIVIEDGEHYCKRHVPSYLRACRVKNAEQRKKRALEQLNERFEEEI